MKNIFIRIAAIAVLFVGAGCTPESPPAPISQEIVYTNTKLGFTVIMPPKWKDFTVSQRQIDWGTFKTNSVDIGLPGIESLFNISVMTVQEWKQLQAENLANNIGVLAQNDTVVVSGASAQSVSSEYVERFAEIGGILKTVKIVE
ncbi:MAG: hypothetical protein A3C15_01635 [Candidatus Magasanikbacteria bacterium RIFCSPHIGHO2_02_FULL_50_9b]|uniref:Uncharacterized protein n=1 Tax=Candidatus Magasanikbacteria bacterium RIFCSPHIGHO2_02_FULL_50_9b TaxID=1798682 RepID=A0A1F6M8L0_9BACT|nr:MAG: hypothetical protein A3C15_01635 [Candidatus Magasanikbacteria bacterium RIFCSPHIGHO2_02_FULL_50_9b]